MYGDYVCDIYENYLRSALVDMMVMVICMVIMM